MINFIQTYIDELRKKVIVYEFASQEDEIIFFKELKPQVLSKQLYFNKIYCIEPKFPTGSNEAAKQYLNGHLYRLEYYFNRHLDFHQYYRWVCLLFDYLFEYQINTLDFIRRLWRGYALMSHVLPENVKRLIICRL